MKKIYFSIAIYLFFLKLGYGNSFPSIIGGNNSTIDQQPWTVFLTSNINNTDRCGGAIIGSSWIVTAGHCVEGRNLNSYKVYAGISTVSPHNVSPMPNGIPIAQIITHPNYQHTSTTLNNDIALIRLSTPLQFNSNIQPIRFDGGTGISNPSTSATFAGWGVIADNTFPNTYQPDMKRISLTIGNITTLPSSNYDFALNSGAMLSAGGGGVGPCFGDSGGPLWVNSGGTNYLIGIDSFKSKSNCGVDPAIFTRVSNYCNWIYQTMIDALAFNGPSVICSSSASTIQLTGELPPNSTTTWSVGSSLQVKSQTASSVSIQATGNNNSSVSATFSTACGNLTKTKPIWAGPPDVTSIKYDGGTSASTMNYVSAGNNHTVYLDLANAIAANITGGVNWSASPALGYGYDQYFHKYSFTLSSGQSIYFNPVSASNSCGTSSRPLAFAATSSYRVSPNPSTTAVRIEFDPTTEAATLPDQIDLLSESSTIPVKTVDVQSAFKNNQLKSGTVLEIDVKNLKRGIYYLQVKNGRLKEKPLDVIRLLLQ